MERTKEVLEKELGELKKLLEKIKSLMEWKKTIHAERRESGSVDVGMDHNFEEDMTNAVAAFRMTAWSLRTALSKTPKRAARTLKKRYSEIVTEFQHLGTSVRFIKSG